MKLLHTISALGLSLLLFSACNSDLDTVTYDADQSTPAVLQPIEKEAYVLDAQKSEEKVITFQWTKPDMGYDASVTTSLEMDIKGKGFSKAVTLASTKTDTSFDLIASVLNKSIMKLLEDYALPFGAVDVEFRMASSISKATNSIYSNVTFTNVTPYQGEKEYPMVYVVGDYAGWDFAQCQHLYSENSNDTYEGWIVFNGKAAGGWKITPEAKWDTAWGYDGVFANTLTLATGTDNIKCFSGYSYKFSFNTTTLQLKTLAAVQSWGVVGGHNGWGNNDTPMTLGKEEKGGKTQYFLSATISMAAGNTFKIRADEDWANQVNTGSVEGEFEADGENFKVTEAGTYTIKWYFNKVKGQLTVTK